MTGGKPKLKKYPNLEGLNVDFAKKEIKSIPNPYGLNELMNELRPTLLV